MTADSDINPNLLHFPIYLYCNYATFLVFSKYENIKSHKKNFPKKTSIDHENITKESFFLFV